MAAEASFQGPRLRIARLLNGWTKAELAEKLGISRQFVHALEIGAKPASKEMLAASSLVLKVTPQFFFQPLTNEVREEQCHFRSRAAMPDKVAEQVISRGTAIELLVRFLDTKLSLPPVDFPAVEARDREEIEAAANSCREHWALGMGPIANMSRVLETAGAVVTFFHTDRHEVDALSMARMRPIVVRNVFKTSPGRSRFDLAHECAHLVIHQGISTGDKETESQANQFAAAFLMPRKRFIQEFPRMPARIEWQAIYGMKVRWRVSAKAVLRRAKELGLLDAVQYASGNRYLNQSGQAKIERFDDQLPSEVPELLRTAIMKYYSLYAASASDLAGQISMTPALLEQLIGADTLRGAA
jgi:Zn-dependent peptidase ImmA (M78 family)/transcriptional regulator with XRE-family HTH domain